MSSSFVAAAARRTDDVRSDWRPPPWDELPGPALLSTALHLVDDWPDTTRALLSAAEVCRSWHDAMVCDAVWAALCDVAGLVQHTRSAYIEHRLVAGGLLDESVLPDQLDYGVQLSGRLGASCMKRSSHPDTSWAFSARGFNPEDDRHVIFSVRVRGMGDEMRVGFTDNREALLERQAFMTYNEPHAWLFSDGGVVRGAHEAGRSCRGPRRTPCPVFREGDVVTVLIDFARDEASWFVNLHSVSSATHAHTMLGLPGGRLFAAIVLDEGGDLIVFEPFVPANERRMAMALLNLARRHAPHCTIPDSAAALGVRPIEWAAAVAGEFLEAEGAVALHESQEARFARFDEWLPTCHAEELLDGWAMQCGLAGTRYSAGGSSGEFLGWNELLEEEEEAEE